MSRESGTPRRLKPGEAPTHDQDVLGRRLRHALDIYEIEFAGHAWIDDTRRQSTALDMLVGATTTFSQTRSNFVQLTGTCLGDEFRIGDERTTQNDEIHLLLGDEVMSHDRALDPAHCCNGDLHERLYRLGQFEIAPKRLV